ncbi:18328_t:CDS:2, partial [Racocetra persica]
NPRLKYKRRAKRKGNSSIITIINWLQQENKKIPSGRVNTIVKYLPSSRAVGKRMILSEEWYNEVVKSPQIQRTQDTDNEESDSTN